MINYFNFKRIRNQYLLTNDLGRYIFITPDQFRELMEQGTVSDPIIDNRLRKNAFIFDSSVEAFLDNFENHMINAKKYLFLPTQLHIFVVNTACNMQCVYCQAQNGEEIPNAFMSRETAQAAVEIALQSPSNNLQFEFQGGEPLLNFDIIRFIVEYSRERAGNKNIRYSIVSNLTLLTDEMVQFIRDNEIEISTSLDGPASIHNLNRPYKNGLGTYGDLKEKIAFCRNNHIQVGAILTVTKNSLSSPTEIIDEYLASGFNRILLRALTPLGCANKRWPDIGYTPKEFLEFYKTAFDYILELNLKGTYISEGIASIFLSKIIEGVAVNYMELRSPCGATLGQIAYYCDGKIYTCDEGRMIAEMGDDSFCIGTVYDNNYNEITDSVRCKGICSSSVLESLPSCCDCVYQPYCGVCPAVNYALYGDLYEKEPSTYRCEIYKGILDIIFERLLEDDYEIRQIFRSWLQ